MNLDPGPRIEGDDSAVLRHALSFNPEGWAMEFGVGAGGSLALIADHMPVIGFDSFEGLPEDWRPDEGFNAGMFAQSKIPQIENATVVVGLFADTLPAFDWPDRVGLVHIDCDLYSSTRTVLEHAGHMIQSGTILVFDEMFGYSNADQHEEKAFTEWALSQNLAYQVLGHGREQWACMVLARGELVADA